MKCNEVEKMSDFMRIQGIHRKTTTWLDLTCWQKQRKKSWLVVSYDYGDWHMYVQPVKGNMQNTLNAIRWRCMTCTQDNQCGIFALTKECPF